MSELPFDKLDVLPPFRQVFTEVQERISKYTKEYAQHQWRMDQVGWYDLAWEDPDWARDQVLRARASAQIAKEVAQEHVVSRFQSYPSQLDEATLISWRQDTHKALSQALELASKCIQEGHKLGDQEINKTRILEKVSPSAPSRGGFER